MNRRTYLAASVAALAGAAVSATAATARPIELHVDLKVDPAKEQELISHFEKVFKPTAMKQKGYISLKLLKLNQVIAGPTPVGGKYRFDLEFESEALRQIWINSADHKRVWPGIENCLTDKNIPILIYDVY